MRSLLASLILVCALFVAAPRVEAQSMHSVQSLQDGIYYSDQFQGKTLWIKWDAAGYSGCCLASAVRLNSKWGITAAHIFQMQGFSYSNFQIGDGSNAITDPGNLRTVTEWYVHPTWQGVFDGQAVDLAVFKWEQPLPGQDVSIADVSLDEIVTYSGFGVRATAALGYIPPSDRQRRAFDQKIDTFGPFGHYSTIYAKGTFFPPGPNFLPMGGNMTPGSSGSGGFKSTGELAIIASTFIGPTGYGSSTTGARVALYADWINPIIALPQPPRPHIAKAVLHTGSVSPSFEKRICTTPGPC